MGRYKRVILFVCAAAALNLLLYYTVTINGYTKIYESALKFCSSEVDITDSEYGEFELLDDALESDMLFIWEMNPGTAYSSELIYNTAVYLGRELGARYIVTDLGYAEAEYLNLYLGGDDSALALLLSEKRGDMNTDEFIDMVKSLKDHSEMLDDRMKLKFIGIGTGSKDICANFIDLLFASVEGKRKDAYIGELFSSETRKSDPTAYFNAINESMTENSQPFRELFSDKYHAFTVALSRYLMDDMTETERVEYMAARLSDEYERSVGDRYMVFTAERTLYDTLCSANTAIKEKIYHGRLIYDNCKYLESVGKGPEYSFGFEEFDESEAVYAIDDRIFRCFEGWRRFVYSANGAEFVGYNDGFTGEPSLITVFCGSPAMTEAEFIPETTTIEETTAYEDNDID